jgi:hypothetical protein
MNMRRRRRRKKIWSDLGISRCCREVRGGGGGRGGGDF